MGHKKCDTCYKTKHTTKFAFKRGSKDLRDTCRTCVGRAAQGAGGGWGFRPGFVPGYKGRRYEDVRLKS